MNQPETITTGLAAVRGGAHPRPRVQNPPPEPTPTRIQLDDGQVADFNCFRHRLFDRADWKAGFQNFPSGER
jgi:hypothetical protein